jgi:hypothetical protein
MARSRGLGDVYKRQIQRLYDLLSVRPPAVVLWAASGARGTASYAEVDGMFGRVAAACDKAVKGLKAGSGGTNETRT